MPRKIYTVVGATAQVISPPVHPDAPDTNYPNPQRLYMYAETGAWRFREGDYSALGSELVSNGALASATDWTIGTGGAITAGKATWDGSQSANSDLTQDTDDTGAALIEGEVYTVAFTTSGVSAGNICAVIGGTLGTNRSTSNTFTQNIVAGSDGLIVLRADLDFIGSVDDISVKRAITTVTAPTASQPNGTGSWAIPAQTSKDIAPTPSLDYQVTVVGTDGSSVLSYYWE